MATFDWVSGYCSFYDHGTKITMQGGRTISARLTLVLLVYATVLVGQPLAAAAAPRAAPDRRNGAAAPLPDA